MQVLYSEWYSLSVSFDQVFSLFNCLYRIREIMWWIWIINFDKIVVTVPWQPSLVNMANYHRYPTRKTFAMWKIARIGQGNHKKAWKQEIRREHNSNPLQRQSHVLVVFPANNYNINTQFLLVGWWPILLLYIHFGMCAYNHDDLWWIDVPNTCSVEHRYTQSIHA